MLWCYCHIYSYYAKQQYIKPLCLSTNQGSSIKVHKQFIILQLYTIIIQKKKKPISLKSLIRENKKKTTVYMVFYFYVTKLDICIVVLLHMQSMLLLKKKTLVHCLSCKLNSMNFFHGALFLLDITADKLQTMISQTSVFERHFLKKRGACHLKNKWDYLLPMITMEFSSRSCNFRKLVSITMTVISSQYFKGFSGEIKWY